MLRTLQAAWATLIKAGGQRSAEALIWLLSTNLRQRALMATGALAILALVAAWRTVPSSRSVEHAATSQARRVGAPAALVPPGVEPVSLLAIDQQTARQMNAAMPFATGANPPARPFESLLTGDELLRSIDCLAAAELYEAGDDPDGQRAVAQVVLNRMRHPAFPNTVCGVVFQGSERVTGCQFTFTCDGALARSPSPQLWAQAQVIARQALAGAVYKPVGLATHYHTDWVVPYWQSSLDKIAQVHTHLFFRWQGWWGTPPAFRQSVGSAEPHIAKLAFASDVHKPAEALAAIRLAEATSGLTVQRDGASFLVALSAAIPADKFAAMAALLCGTQDKCRVTGWADPKKVPQSGGGGADALTLATASFAFTRDRAGGKENALWNCAEYPRANPGECMAAPAAQPATAAALAAVPASDPGTVLALTESAAAADAPPVPAPAPAPPKRRRIDPCAAMRNVDDRIGFCANR